MKRTKIQRHVQVCWKVLSKQNGLRINCSGVRYSCKFVDVDPIKQYFLTKLSFLPICAQIFV